MDVLFENKDLLISAMANINSYDEERDPRVIWLRDFAHYAKECRMQGGVAECGTIEGSLPTISINIFQRSDCIFSTHLQALTRAIFK